MSAKRSVKARKMWANYYGDDVPIIHNTLERARREQHAMNRQPVYVFPADAASYDAMREQVIEEIRDQERMSDEGWEPGVGDLADGYLAAIGIVRPQDRPAKTRK